jgi:hypothetical protein
VQRINKNGVNGGKTMEKFYIVTNEKFLKEINDYRKHEEERRIVANNFFENKGIVGEEYYISGDGFVNRPFKEHEKNNIRLYISDCNENDQKFGKELLKPTKLFSDSDVLMRKFRANSKTLKEFQNLCIEKNIVINNHSIREGDYFKELHLGGYSVSRFEYENKLYLKISTTKYETITPDDDTSFTEIKGSEFYKVLEEFESKNK